MEINKLFLLGAFFSISIQLYPQQTIPIYQENIPNSKESIVKEEWKSNKDFDSLVYNVSTPTLTVFLASNNTKTNTAIIICPGGGYSSLLIKREGTDVAKRFANLGITAFVLKYRLPNDQLMDNKSIVPLQDLQQSILYVRKYAKQFGDIKFIGLMGYSAGGHLVALEGTHSDENFIVNKCNISLKPDFMILVNPVISFNKKIGHKGTINNLLGNNISLKQRRFYSNELNVSKITPPTFLVHAVTDRVVPVENSICFFKSLKKQDVEVEMHLYSKGEHGFLTAPTFDEWFGRCVSWIKNNKWL